MVEELIEPTEIELIGQSKEDLDEIDKKRLLEEWKKSFSYYSFNPEDFKFKFSDL